MHADVYLLRLFYSNTASMTKVVTYLFDNMFQGKRKITFLEKLFVISVAAIVLTTTTLLFLV